MVWATQRVCVAANATTGHFSGESDSIFVTGVGGRPTRGCFPLSCPCSQHHLRPALTDCILPLLLNPLWSPALKGRALSTGGEK